MKALTEHLRTLAIALAAITCAALTVAPAAVADESVRSGPLEAKLRGDPWHLELSGISRGGALVEVGAAGPTSLGTLGFETDLGWYHATRVIASSRDGDAVQLTAATNDPLGRKLAVRIAPDGDGVIRLDANVEGLPGVTTTGIGFGSADGERFLGFGERSNAIDQRGGQVENYVADGPYQANERPIIQTFVPPDGFRGRDDATYFPMPWLLSTRGYGVLVGNTERSAYELGTQRSDGWSVEVDSPSLELRFFAGPDPADAVRRLSAQVGRQPAPAAPWFFGPWYQPHGNMSEPEQAAKLRREDVPASAANTYLHYLPCGDQEGVEAQQPERTADFHKLGYAVTTYFNPMVCSTYRAGFDEAAQRGLLTQSPAGGPSLYRYSASTDDLFLVGQFDFSNPATDDYYANLLGEAVDDGYDGWMEDFGEYTPLDSKSANGMSGRQMHNLYPVLYHRSSYRFAQKTKRTTQPVAGFIRSGWTGVAPYAQMVWGGDPTVDFGFDGLSSAVKQALNLGASGVSRWGSDIGGFFALGRKLSPELLVRWIQFGAVSPIMRTEANGVNVPKQPRPQITDPEILPTWRRYAKLHTQLYPYLRGADAEYRRSGLPIMRQLALSYPGDAAATAREDEFMFGPDLLAAPVLSDGERERRLYLPRGRWIDFWDAISYGERRGAFRPAARAKLLRGGGEVSVPAPLERLPLMIRAGAVLPMLPPDVDTLASYGGGDDLVRLDERRHKMVLLAFPRGRSSADFNESERLVSREKRNRWRLSIKGRTKRSYRVRASLASLRHPFRPRSVRVGGRELSRKLWRYDRRTKTLRFAAKLRRGRIVVRAR